MQKFWNWKTLFLLLVIGGVLLAVTPALAQTEAAAESSTTNEAPSGLGTLMLVLGTGAVIIVGGAMWARERFTGFSDGDDDD
jgi:hypothetical protein